jgi:uncharacterized protein HemX
MAAILNDTKTHAALRVGSQPIAIGAAVLVALVVAGGSILAWRSYNGIVPEQDRVVTARVNQARVAQASEQLVEKTKGLEATQQQSIDQLQAVEDRLQVIQQMLVAQRTENKRLGEQVAALTGSFDTLRQSFASVPPPAEAAPAPTTNRRSVRKSRAGSQKKATTSSRKRSRG